MFETIYKVSVCALIAMVFIGFEVESWPLKRVLFKKVFNRKTKTEKPLRILIITKSSGTADTLFNLLRLIYQKSAVVALGIFKRKIRFSDNEYWYITSYLEDEFESLDLNIFDKIILDFDLSISTYQKVADKTSKHSALRVCSMTDLIIAVTNKEIE